MNSPIRDERRFVFSYTITIRNEGQRPGAPDDPALGHHRSNGKVQEVRGEGVVGEQPYLKPGQGFRYSSGAVSKRRWAPCRAATRWSRTTAQQFDAPIAPFTLAMPGLLH